MKDEGNKGERYISLCLPVPRVTAVSLKQRESVPAEENSDSESWFHPITRVPPTVFVFLAILSTQLGAAIAEHLFAEIQPAGTVLLRIGFAALVLCAVGRPRFGGYSPRAYVYAALFGVSLGAMNFAFYSALDRIPLGVAVTLEFSGPLGVALFGSRRVLDVLWALMAGAGILLLAPWSNSRLDPLGIGLALVAGSMWAAYILLSARVGRAFTGGTGLALAMLVATGLMLPVGISQAGSQLLQPGVLILGLGVALLSSALPYSLELEALRRLPTRAFGVLMSMEPATAALVGWLVLRQTLNASDVAAILLVTLASAGSSRYG